MKKLVCIPAAEQAATHAVPRPPVGADVYLGIDVARSKWVYAVRWGGQHQRSLSSPGALPHLQALVAEYGECRLHVVYEACGFGYEIAWWCQAQRLDVMVIAPSRVERAPGRRVKTDRIDARTMARKREEGQLKGIYIPRRAEHERRQLSRTYEQVCKDGRRAQVQVRSLLQEQGRIGPAPSARWVTYTVWLRQQALPPLVQRCVEERLTLRATARASAQRLRQDILALAAAPEYAPVVQALDAQPGVSPFTAIRFVLEIGDIARFPTVDSIAHYCGLTPSEHSSGDLERRGHILKTGPTMLRRWVLQCAWVSIRGSNADAALKQAYERLMPRVGKKRAIVAVARRLVVRLRARWRDALQPSAHAA